MSVFTDERDAQIESTIAIEGDADVLAAMEVEPGIVGSMTITYFGDHVVWDHATGLREVSVAGQLLYLDDDGMWRESDEFEWPLFGALGEWAFAQSIAASCLEVGADVVGTEDVTDVPTLHIRCEVESSSLDAWIDASGLVMKLSLVEVYGDGPFTVETHWEVVALDVEPAGPLPPGV